MSMRDWKDLSRVQTADVCSTAVCRLVDVHHAMKLPLACHQSLMITANASLYRSALFLSCLLWFIGLVLRACAGPFAGHPWQSFDMCMGGLGWMSPTWGVDPLVLLSWLPAQSVHM